NVTYCHPEVASVGLTEQRAKEQGLDYEVGSFPWSANGRARTAGETEGFVKIIRDKKYGEILGAHIVGPSASELIGEFVLGRHLESTVEELERAMHPHPTRSEAIAEAALASMGRVIHMQKGPGPGFGPGPGLGAAGDGGPSPGRDRVVAPCFLGVVVSVRHANRTRTNRGGPGRAGCTGDRGCDA